MGLSLRSVGTVIFSRGFAFAGAINVFLGPVGKVGKEVDRKKNTFTLAWNAMKPAARISPPPRSSSEQATMMQICQKFARVFFFAPEGHVLDFYS